MCVFYRSRHVLGLVVAEVGFSWAWFTLLHHAREYLVTLMHVPDHQVRTFSTQLRLVNSPSFSFIILTAVQNVES